MVIFLKENLKYSWLLVTFFIVTLIIWNTNQLFETVKNEERKKIKLWALAQEELIENNIVNNLTFEVLQQTWINPMIQVNKKGKIIGIKNISWDVTSKDSAKLYSRLKRIKKENRPIIIRYQDSISSINQKLYYGDSPLLKKLQYYPIALLLIIILFGALLYFVFKTSKKSDQNQLWTSMAKETAHQIATPLSSMIGWVTLMKSKIHINEPLNEIEKDLERLQLITDRFSKMGFLPELQIEDIILQTTKTVKYIEKRSSKLVEFKIKIPKGPLLVPLNKELFSWTLENLLKNAIDAIKGKGKVDIEIENKIKTVVVNVSDSGYGMKKELFKKIFYPGFTSKKRGWGLGLSLAKRIINDYHRGKISVKSSSIDEGTTFEIILNKNI